MMKRKKRKRIRSRKAERRKRRALRDAIKAKNNRDDLLNLFEVFIKPIAYEYKEQVGDGSVSMRDIYNYIFHTDTREIRFARATQSFWMEGNQIYSLNKNYSYKSNSRLVPEGQLLLTRIDRTIGQYTVEVCNNAEIEYDLTPKQMRELKQKIRFLE